MCGLAGRFHPEQLAPAEGWAARASTLLAHRGPDGSGTFRDERCELVHRRLALLDLTPTGAQPMGNGNASVHIVYNGEIYNHQELREELRGRGHEFRGTSDTEVVLRLYEELGPRCVERLRGIFAFAVYDRPRRRLFLARDRFGVKPLFYALHDGALLFASEMKAILAVPGFRPALDRQACYDYLGLGYVPEPATGFANIHALSHGCTLLANGRHKIARYYVADVTPEHAHDMDAAAEQFASRLSAAVGRQSVADVPVAALLSGGIDSSLVVAAHYRAVGTPAATFNVRFPDQGYDETPFATLVAEQCGMVHTTVDVAAHQLSADALLELMRHFDQPFADASFIPMYAVSRAVRDRGIICTLSGDGGDEAFGGYQRFWQLNRLHRLMRAPASVRGAARMAATPLRMARPDLGRRLAKAATLAGAGRHDSGVLLAGLESYLSERQKLQLVTRDARLGLHAGDRLFDGHRPAGVTDLEELSRRMTETLFTVSLPSDMLRKVDMMSMRAGIEVRVPMLDEAVVDLGLSLPHRLKTDGTNGKLVPRALARRWLPPRVARHGKQGFSIPLDVMAGATLGDAAHDLLAGAGARLAGVVKRRRVMQWVTAFAAARTRGTGRVSREGRFRRVLMLLSLEQWMRDHRLSW